MTDNQGLLDHKFIWLQSRENMNSLDDGRTWCQDSIYEDDTKYIRYDLFDEQTRQHIATQQKLDLMEKERLYFENRLKNEGEHLIELVLKAKKAQQKLDVAVEALKNAFDGLIYATHLVNGYKHFDEQGNEVLSSSIFGVIKDRYKEAEAALASIKE